MSDTEVTIENDYGSLPVRSDVTVVFSQDKVWRVPYRLARWVFHVSYWLHLLGDWLDEVADRG